MALDATEKSYILDARSNYEDVSTAALNPRRSPIVLWSWTQAAPDQPAIAFRRFRRAKERG